MEEKETQKYLHSLYLEIVSAFDEMLATEEASIKFSEYVKRYATGVQMLKPGKHQFGKQAEDFVRTILCGVKDIRITKTTPMFDNFYGADFKVQHEHNGKAASLYVDVKLNTKFEEGVSFLHHTGSFVEASQASRFSFSFGTVYFGIKNSQHSFFTYEKPVVVMYISNFKVEVKEDELNTLAFILCNINRLLIDQGYSYRISQFVIPNYKHLNR